MFTGKSIQLKALGEGLVELVFARQEQAINKLDTRTMQEFEHVVGLLEQDKSVRGVLVTSDKEVFIVGADITEFGARFQHSAAQITEWVIADNKVGMRFEDLAIPTVVAINGYALGGGLEIALLANLRVMADSAQIGVPEVTLGIYPGLGGTVRLARIIGSLHAIEWVAGGAPVKAAKALELGAVDAVVPLPELRASALALLQQAVQGQVDWQAKQARKRVAATPWDGDSPAGQAVLKAAKGQAKRHLPAALTALEMMAKAAALPREQALNEESRVFGELAKSQATASLVQAFLNGQTLKKITKSQADHESSIQHAAVLGAGIMGGGIAFVSARNGIPVRMNDIAQAALDQGMGEAKKLLDKQVQSGRLSDEQASQVLGRITPQLDRSGFDQVDCVIEAIVEKLEVKQQVLGQLEPQLAPTTIIASNTSSLRIDDIGANLQRPQNLVGMHFFNPVPMMPLVEIVRGSHTSDAAVAAAVGYALKMKKTPIVVKDCPGFLVNRILTAYMRGFLQLVNDGADFQQVDAAMEAFGWPMGPAYLEDVVGMDTGSHVSDVISAGYPERMPHLEHDALRLMVAHQRFGQKNGIGFYRYETDPRGKPQRTEAGDTKALLARIQPKGQRDFTEQEIVERMMLPMLVESAHALEEGIVSTPAELDTALRLGLGFPAHAGGPLQYADWLGLAHVVERCAHYAHLGKAYQATEQMRQMAQSGGRYYPIGE